MADAHRPSSASERFRAAEFPIVMRGYDRHSVDQFVAEVLALVESLESSQTREGVVQKALDELGEETAGILQRAHETADDITARSRAQADARLQRAERESELLRRDADEYAEQVIVDTRVLWDERQRLIDDLRQLADEVLGTADDAIDRLKLPEQLGSVSEVPAEGAPAEAPLAAEPAAGDEAGFAAQPPADDAPFAADPHDAEPHAAPDPAPTQPLRLGAVPDEPYEDEPLDGDPEVEATEESGHTVELEALPGGSEEPPPEREQS